MTGVPRTTRLKVVGVAASITGSADAWVMPAEIARLRWPGAPATAQMLYRFRSAATTTAVSDDIAAVTAALSAGAVTATQSYLTVRSLDVSHIAVDVPFLIIFSIIGLALALLIVVNVVSGAVVASYTRIGILKGIGFTPGQVAAVYAGLGLVRAAAGCLAGVVLGNVLARPLLAHAAYAYGVGVLGVPAWVDVDTAVAMCGLTAIAALAPAVRAARLSSVAVIAAGTPPGRAVATPRTGC